MKKKKQEIIVKNFGNKSIFIDNIYKNLITSLNIIHQLI